MARRRALVTLSLMALACLLRLGSFPHYWLAVVPFALYVPARATLLVTRVRLARILRAAMVGFGALSAIAALSFLALVHRHDGLPGEYGPSYRTQPRR
jgi:hypothetical protein